MLTLDDTFLSLEIQQLKKRFEDIRVDLRYVSSMADSLIRELNETLLKIEDLGDDMTHADIIL